MMIERLMISHKIFRGSFLLAVSLHMFFLGIFAFSFRPHFVSPKPSLTFLGSIVGKYELANVGRSGAPEGTFKIPSTVGNIPIPHISSVFGGNIPIKKPASSIDSVKKTMKQPVIVEEPPAAKVKENTTDHLPVFRPREPLKL